MSIALLYQPVRGGAGRRLFGVKTYRVLLGIRLEIKLKIEAAAQYHILVLTPFA